jgi:drug/metabolite transporter (DMT)-like permease
MADEPSPLVLAVSVDRAATERSVRIGYLYAAIAALLFSSKGIVIKLAYGEGLDPETLLGIRLGLALPVYLAIGALSLRDRARQGRSLPGRRLVAGAALVGVLGYYVASYTDFLGLQYISAQFERMILFTFPLFVVLFGAWFFGQPIRRAALIAIAISYAGLAIIFTNRVQALGSDVVLGASFVLTAAIAFALYQLLAKPLIGIVGPRLFTCIAMTAAAAVAIAQFLITHPLSDLSISTTAFWYALLLAIGATIAPTFLLAAALHRISAQSNAMIGMLSPIATIVLAWFVLGERLGAADMAGAALVLVGVGVMTLRGGELESSRGSESRGT